MSTFCTKTFCYRGNAMSCTECTLNNIFSKECTFIFEHAISNGILHLVPLTAYMYVMGYYDSREYWLSLSFRMANRVAYQNHGHAQF
jgi:hypothetical protein